MRLTGASARRKAGVQEWNYSRIARCAAYFHSIIMVRCMNTDNASLNQANYETKGFHIKAKSCNFGPMREFVCADPKLSKLSFKKDGWKKQQNYLRHADGAEPIGLTLPRSRIEELFQLEIISEEAHAPIPKKLQKSAKHPHRKTLAVQATFNKSAGKGKLDRNLRDILKYVYYLTTDAEQWDDKKALYQVFFAPSLLKPGHVRRLEVLTNPPLLNDIQRQRSAVMDMPDDVLSGRDFDDDTDYLRAVIADYDLFGTWTNVADDYRNHYMHTLRFDEYLKRFRRCVPGGGGIYDYRHIDEFSRYEDAELGNVSANLVKIIRALNRADRAVGAAPIARANIGGGDAALDRERRKYVHHSDETGRPCLHDLDLPVYIVVPPAYADLCYGATEIYIDDLDNFIGFAAKMALNKDFIVEFNPGWELDIQAKLEQKQVNFIDHLPVPGAKADDLNYRRDASEAMVRVRDIVNRGYRNRLIDSSTQAALAAYTQYEQYFGLHKVEDLERLRQGDITGRMAA